MKFEQHDLLIISDFDIRVLREDKNDMDLLIPIDQRPINMVFCDMPNYMDNRFQFNSIYGILIRIAKYHNNWATIHILKNIDLNSSFINFEICYDHHLLNFTDHTSSIEFVIKKQKGC